MGQFSVDKDDTVNKEGWLQWLGLVDHLKTEPKYHTYMYI